MLDQWIQDPEKIGVIVILLGAVYALLRGHVLPPGCVTKEMYNELKAQCERERAEKEEFKQLALQFKATADKALTIGEKVVTERKK